MKKSYETNADMCMPLLQLRSTPIGPRLPSLATLLFNRLARSMLQRFSRPPIICDNDERNHAELKQAATIKQ